MDKVKEVLQFIGLKIMEAAQFIWKYLKIGFKKLRRWFKRYVRKLIRHTKAKDYSLLIYTIIAIIVFILFIVLLGKLFSHGKKNKEKKTTTEVTTEAITEDPAVEAHNQLVAQANTIYQNNQALLVLVNDSHPIDEGYSFEQYTLNCGEIIDARSHTDLVNMLEACNDAGNEYTIVSGYRDKTKQQQDFDDTVARIVSEEGLSEEDAAAKAALSVQKPGYSEHETGLAIDISGLGKTELNESLASDPTVAWLDNNCHLYGYIVRYPSGKTDVTGITYEPWHFRYVGVEAATFMHDNNLTLEEFYQLIGM
ncbi:MAG: M15 family metallopeptidase [Lachnospiraceae bacterium]|nr:M15 family metallopeptidase [Lachnospiraceae bacterium]